MAVDRFLSGSLVLLVLFVVPGLLSIKSYRRLSQVADHDSRLDAIVYSLSVSIAAVLLLYGMVQIAAGTPLTIPVLADAITLPLAIHGYLAHISIAFLIGIYVGVFTNHIYRGKFSAQDTLQRLWEKDFRALEDARNDIVDGDTSQTRAELWDYIFDKIYSQSEITVVKTDGEDVCGEVLISGDSVQSRDFLLSTATRDQLEQEGPPDEKYTYIPPNDISHITFNEDLNADDSDVAEREVGPAPESSNPELIETAMAIAMTREEAESIDELIEIYGVDSEEELREKLQEEIED